MIRNDENNIIEVYKKNYNSMYSRIKYMIFSAQIITSRIRIDEM